MTLADVDRELVRQAQTFLQRGQIQQALQTLQPALAAPYRPVALKLLLQLALHQQLMPLAAQALRTGMMHAPGDPDLHALAAAGARIAGQAEGLARSARRALAIDPAQPLAAALLSEHLGDQLQISEALQVTEQCLSERPREWGVLLARANLLLFAGDAAGASEAAEAAARGQQSLQAMQAAANAQLYLDDAPATMVMAKHRTFASRIPAIPLPPPAPRASGGQPLRVALLSPDLRRHPVGELIEPLLRSHDRDRLHLVVYQDGAADAQTARLRAFGTDWRETHAQPDEALARRMREDHIEVLVDMAGHTAGSRPRLLASRVAQRQLGYLGYLFDTGATTLDGVIGDAYNLPEGTTCARNPLRMDGSFICFMPPADAPDVTTRDTGPITFGSFNHLAKLSPATLALWARVLDAVPGSRLRLCALGLADAGVRERLTSRFATLGVDPGRLDLRAPLLDPNAFLHLYDDVDIALDPLPFGGGMTTLQALWQGVPVLTLPGERMAARSGLSILSAAGLHDCVADDADAFVQMALRRAEDADGRRRLRAELRDRLRDSPLVDAPRFACAFADALERAPASVH